VTPTATSLPPGVRVFRSRPEHQVHAVRLHPANVDVISQWIFQESGIKPLWNDGRLHLTSTTGLVSAGPGDMIVQSLFGFSAYSAREFSTLYVLADLPTRAALRDMSVAELVDRTPDDPYRHDCE
jgi:hypothetical protein